ncbi:MAG: type II toxin-antitoxin system HicB family antitoxin [Anaerolinea sp.]|nr:type II toxin-antitoxin system HicB family antitoxin [Anaerolinea sp.]
MLDDIIIPITVDYLEEDQVYQVSCPWLQGCHAWGETLDEAMRAIPDNIRAMIAARRQKGSPLPVQLESTVFDLRQDRQGQRFLAVLARES